MMSSHSMPLAPMKPLLQVSRLKLNCHYRRTLPCDDQCSRGLVHPEDLPRRAGPGRLR